MTKLLSASWQEAPVVDPEEADRLEALDRLDCTIRSLGDEGAGIDVWNAHDIPEKFTLVIAPENVERQCLVASRSEKHLEVQFC